MIQFNLLPDVKLEYIKTKRSQQVVTSAAILVGAASLAILILFFFIVNVVQKKHLKDVDKDIASYSQQLKNNQELPKILTVQNQLNALPALHAAKPVTSRLFGYLSKVVPNKASVSQLSIDFAQNTMTITGSADSIVTVNQFVDTLKFTTLSTSTDGNSSKPFSKVVLGTFSPGEKGTTFTITLAFDHNIFESGVNPDLVVPKITTTRSETDKPTDLFKPSPTTKTTGGQ